MRKGDSLECANGRRRLRVLADDILISSSAYALLHGKTDWRSGRSPISILKIGRPVLLLWRFSRIARIAAYSAAAVRPYLMAR